MQCRVLIWGAGGHAKVIAEILRLSGHEVVGFIDDINQGRRGEPFAGATVIGGSDDLTRVRQSGVSHAIIGFGDNVRRCESGEIAKARGFVLTTAIHPSVILGADTVVGEGSVLAAGAVINPGARLGRSVIVNTSATIDHDCIIADGVHVGPCANIAGHVTIDSCAWIGIGATIIDHKHIGAKSIVGAGAVVVDDVPAGVVVAGVPARFLKSTS
jgi:sugar O-acyltransferase (sialic acid O-acetyltransferase NeuD family)